MLEEELIARLDLPLNLPGNSHNNVYLSLKRLRAEAVAATRSVIVVANGRSVICRFVYPELRAWGEPRRRLIRFASNCQHPISLQTTAHGDGFCGLLAFLTVYLPAWGGSIASGSPASLARLPPIKTPDSWPNDSKTKSRVPGSSDAPRNRWTESCPSNEPT